MKGLISLIILVVSVEVRSVELDAMIISTEVNNIVCSSTPLEARVVVKNSGTKTWRNTGEKTYWLGSENPRDNMNWGTNRAEEITMEVPPNTEYTFKFTVHSPSTPGYVNFQWMMLENEIAWFGEKTPNKEIMVMECKEVVEREGLKGKVMLGYQGWFTLPDDGSKIGWMHYFGGGINRPTTDLWPDMGEYIYTHPTTLKLVNGELGTLYSAWDEASVTLHMKWLRDYNLSGVWLQRFTSELTGGNVEILRNKVLESVGKGSSLYGRVFGVMYDISTSSHKSMLEVIKGDWAKIGSVGDHPRYIRYLGRPIISIFGIGYSTNGYAYTPEETLQFMNYMKSTYNLSIMISIPNNFHSAGLGMGTYPYSEFKRVYASADFIMPWQVGNFRGGSYSNVYNIYRDNKQIIDALNYPQHIPLVYPGFTWKNLKTSFPPHDPGPSDTTYNYIPREGGQFLWKLVYNAIATGHDMIYVAMFDEIDEGTAVYKVETTKAKTPASSNFEDKNEYVYLDIDGYKLTSDWYLLLLQYVVMILKGIIPNSRYLPIPIPH